MYVSPGVYSKEIDASLYAEIGANTVYAMAHTFNKGTLDTPLLVTSLEDLKNQLGLPINSAVPCIGWLSAREYLRRGNKLYVTRVDSTTTPADYAAQSIPGGSTATLATANDGATTAIGAGHILTSAGAAFIVGGVLVGDWLEINDTSTPGDNGWYLITLVAATQLTTEREFPTGGLNNLTYTVYPGKKYAGTNGATSIPATRTLTSAGSSFVTAGVAVGDMLRIEGTGGSTGDNGMYRITNVAATILTVDRDFPVGSLAALPYSVFGRSSGGADGSTATPGEFVSAGAQFTLHGVKAGDILVICDTVDTANNGTYFITGCKPAATATTLLVNNATWPGGALAALTYYVLPGAVKFQGLTKGTWCAGYRLYPLVNSGDRQNFDLAVYSGSSVLEQTYNMDLSSVVATMTSDSSIFSASLITVRTEPCPGFGVVDSTLGIYLTVTGGVDGTASIASSDYIAGLNLYLNPEEYEIDIISCPGIYEIAVNNALALIAETRQDCIAIIDPPDWATIDSVQEIINWHNGVAVGGYTIGTTAQGSSYCATYWTWQKVYDEYNAVDRWIAPSGMVAGVFAYNDNQKFPWYAPAGVNRGKLIGSSDVRYSPSKNDRDSMYGPGQSVNAIVKFVGEGIYVYGQKTLYRTSSALNRINTRRMLNYCKRVISKANRALVFEPNDEVLWRGFKQITEPVLKYVLTNRGISDYRIICDSTTVTSTELENYMMKGKLLIKPTPTAEIIALEFTLTSQGSDFSEFIMA
jgi:hypothetical protein